MTGGELLKRWVPEIASGQIEVSNARMNEIGDIRAGNFPVLQPAVDFCRHPDLGKCPDCHADLEDIERVAYKRGFQDAEVLLHGEQVQTNAGLPTDQQKALQKAVAALQNNR